MTGFSPLGVRVHVVAVLRLTFAVAAVVLAAFWLTRLVAPRPVAVLATSGSGGRAVNQSAVYKVFGLGGQAAQSIGMELTGLYRRADGRGFATFRSPRGPLFGSVGEEIQPGVRLNHVGIDFVVLAAGGTELRLELPTDPARSSALNRP